MWKGEIIIDSDKDITDDSVDAINKEKNKRIMLSMKIKRKWWKTMSSNTTTSKKGWRAIGWWVVVFLDLNIWQAECMCQQQFLLHIIDQVVKLFLRQITVDHKWLSSLWSRSRWTSHADISKEGKHWVWNVSFCCPNEWTMKWNNNVRLIFFFFDRLEYLFEEKNFLI